MKRWLAKFEAEYRRRVAARHDPDRHSILIHDECDRDGRWWFRAKCACGWRSDGYSQYCDARRAADVHERRATYDRLVTP